MDNDDSNRPYTEAWYRRQFAGVAHQLLRHEADIAEISALKKRVAAMEKEREADKAKIGELIIKVTELQEWRSRLSTWLQKNVEEKK